ncbi:dynein axonemal heavy chain 6-like isoform X4 [Apostichopus japonicus]|uniref:dynein axonemal heavy chain 6-like isoform X4 n=1 Tax=Stichopus japonicus TaxID=307972 RepID=UPI003AB1C671
MDSSPVKSPGLEYHGPDLPLDHEVPSSEYDSDPFLYLNQPYDNDRSAKSAPAAFHDSSHDGVTGPPPTRASPKGDLSSSNQESSRPKTVKFSSSPDYIQPNSAAHRKGLDLKSRLYDRAQDSQVLKMMRPSSSNVTNVKAKQNSVLPPIPRPPEGPKASTLRTTMFKKDYQRIKLRRKSSNAEMAEKKTMRNDSHKDDDGSIANQEIKRKLSTSQTEGGGAETHSEAEDTSTILNECEEESTVVAPVSPLMQAIKKEFSPDPSVISETSEAIPPTPMGSRSMDSRLVLAYTSTNKFDVAVPAVDSITYHIRKMRQKIGLVVELPRHGPGVKEDMIGIEERLLEPARKYINQFEDSGQFLYALPRDRFNPRARYNPYSLQVVSAQKAKEAGCYFTASAHSVTLRVDNPNGEYDELTPTMQWLSERRVFHALFEMKVFQQFRIWKAFNIWKNVVRATKKSDSKMIMNTELFTANEILQRCMLHIRTQCELACSSADGRGVGDKAISLVHVDPHLTTTLDDFCKLQAEKCDATFLQLNRMRDKIVKITFECCKKVAEMEGIKHPIAPNMGPLTKKVQPLADKLQREGGTDSTKSKSITDSTKKSGPSYTQIAEWRQILGRLSRYLRTVDYIILNMLHRLVKTAVKDLHEYLQISVDTAQELKGIDQDSSDSDDSEADSLVAPRRTGGFKRRTGPVFSESSPGSSRAPSGHPKHATEEEKNIPHYDFDKVETTSEAVDIDEVLEGIKRQEIVEMPPDPIFEAQLVLNVVPLSRPPTGRPLSKLKGLKKKQNPDSESKSPSPSGKKYVTFAGEEQLSSSSEDEEEDDEEGKGEREEEEDSEGYVSEEEGKLVVHQEKQKGQQLSKTDEPDDEQVENPNKVSVTLSPSKSQFLSKIRGIIAGFEHTVGQFSALQRDHYLSVFWSPPRYDLKLSSAREEEEGQVIPWPDIELLFGKDEEYMSMVQNVLKLVAENMESVEQYTQNFEEYCEMVDQARRVDVEHSMNQREWSTEEFHQVLLAHTDMVRAMQSMQTSKRKGMIRVLSSDFQASCLPYPTQVNRAVQARLPVIANRRNEDLLKVIKSATKKLDRSPHTVEEFVDHLSFLSRMGAELPSLEKEYVVVTRLFTIARDFDVIIEPEDLALYQTLMPSFQHLKSVIIYCEAKKDENIAKFSDDLNSHINSLQKEAYEIRSKLQDPALLSPDTMVMVAMENLKLLNDALSVLTTKARSYASYQDRFGSSLSRQKIRGYQEESSFTDYEDAGISTKQVLDDLSEIERDLQLRRLLWESSDEWGKLVADWTITQFDELNVDVMQKNVSKFTQTVFMLEKGLPPNDVLPKLKEKVLNFKQGMPVLVALRNPALRPRHWQEIQKLIGRHIVRDKNFTLGKFLELQLFHFKDNINDISTQASNEATLEVMLNKVIDLWQTTDFRLKPHSGRDFMIIAGADDITAQLEESQVTIATIRGSRYVTPIKGLVEEWDRKLNVFARTLEEWMSCQRNWLYLEQIFMTPDIQRQLPTEAKLFAQVDKTWKDIMRRTEDHPNALKSATLPGVLEMLQANNSYLEKIHRCLEDYLETKRLVFPRFYFLSNDDLLDILAQSRNPDAVQPHLVKCFGNIKTLEIIQEARLPPTVRTMISAEGEAIEFMPKNLRARGPTEQWLGSVESAMFDTVKRHIESLSENKDIKRPWKKKENLKEAVHKWGRDLEDWVLTHPGQVVLTVVQIMFNREVAAALESSSSHTELINARDRLIGRLNTLAGLVGRPMSHFHRKSLEALMTIVVHARDIINNLIDVKTSHIDDFEWTRQLRYQWDEQHNTCIVLQANASFSYGYEYLGCSPRLVITPLTDRCYLTLTGALNLHLGGSPAGPAGTGKTETVKDLAKAVGKLCLVFNCSEGLDFKMMGKFFSGLAQSGSWCCFDEFNRIDVEVLSVVAQQLHSIKTAKDSNALRFMFEGRDIRLNYTCGIFVTMNPGYAGRVELPDNLKSLFRQVAMMVPDYALIAEIMLFSEGFTSAKSLSNKIVNLYQLASKQLSQQDHYDFGMRAIKSVLVMAGQRKRQQQMQNDTPATLTSEQEAFILIHALKDANIPKFLAEDVPLFESILADLFPGVSPPAPNLGTLEKAISMAVRDMNLQHWPKQLEQVKQLHSQLLVRHGCMLVGPSGGGKTTVRNILQKALALLPTLHLQVGENRNSVIKSFGKKGKVDTFSINPKCVKIGELYGQTDPNTLEWTDGLLASAIRRFSRESSHSFHGDDAGDKSVTGDVSIGTRTPRGYDEGRSEVTSPRSSSRGPSPQQRSQTDYSNTAASEAGTSDVSRITQNQNTETPQDWHWLVLDGPVDTLWVENLNTTLDDSKLLCLANGERITLTTGMRLIFEVDNLSQASPATISRCAMVYLDPVDLGWRPFVKTWVMKLSKEIPDNGKQHLLALFEKSIDKGLEFIQQHNRYKHLPVTDLSLVATLCYLLSAFLDFLGKNGGFGKHADEDRPSSGDSLTSGRAARKSPKPGSRRQKSRDKDRSKFSKSASSKEWFLQKHPEQIQNLFGKIFVFCFVWSFGGILKREDDSEDDGGISLAPRVGENEDGEGTNKKKGEVVDINISYEFDGFVHDMFDTEPPLGVRLPSGSRTIFQYFVSPESGKFVPWEELVPSTKSLIEKGVTHVSLGEQMGLTTQMSKDVSLEDSELVPTVDSVRYSFLTSLLAVHKHPVLITGESGVGKSALVGSLLKKLCLDKGSTTQLGTVLGEVFHYSERGTNILSNISALTSGIINDDSSEFGGDPMDLTFITGQVRRSTGGMVSTTLQLSAQTSASRVQAQIEHKLVKRGRETLAGPRGKKVLVFVDDLNLPAPEQYGAQPPLELLRQFMELGGFYDTKKLTWKNILDVTLLAACAPLGGGRNPISPRLLKHFSVLSLPQPSVQSLQHIYQVQLGCFLENGDFLPDIRELLLPLVSASIAIYYKMCFNMLPTPAKSHYTFNLRDLSKVIQGLLQANKSTVTSVDRAAQLLAHEAMRVFHDRLVDAKDRLKFFEFLADDLHNYFRVKWTAEKLQNEPFLFGDFLDLNVPSGERVYRPISDYDKLAHILEEYIVRVNYGGGQENQLVFFKGALEHIIRAARVFRQPGGHMVLVGLDGTGKSTTVHLASHVAGCILYRLTLTRGYGQADFRDDLKKVFKLAGVQGSNTVFLLTDSDIVKESFLEDVNSVLNSGEVPDLFDSDDLDTITMDLKRAAAEAEVPDTRDAVYQFFIQRVRSKLHIVLATSPAGDAFRQRCRTHPSLVNCCTLDWYDEWSNQAMLRVASVFLSQVDFTGIGADQDVKILKDNIAEICVGVHKDVMDQCLRFYQELRRHYYTTPSSYLDLIQLYSKMLRQQKQHYMDNKNRLFVGLSKLTEANSLVDTMQEELVNLGPKIEDKAKDTELLLQQLSRDQEAVDQVKTIVEEQEATMKRETQLVQDYADQAEKDLESVLPALEDATAALDALQKSDISEIRVYNKPPVLVMHVMSAVCVLMKQKPDWKTAKHLLNDAGFLNDLVNYEKDLVSDKVFSRLKKYTQMPGFEPDKVGQVSLACKSICQWVLALEHYVEVKKMVKPRQKRVEEAKEALNLALESLQEKQASLAKIQGHLRVLQEQYDDSVAQRESLRERKVTTQLRLQRASILITALADEKVRWVASLSNLEGKLQGIVGDTLISSSSIIYLGVFTAPYRREMISHWWDSCTKMNIPVSKDFTLTSTMAEANTIREWQNEGLPQDNHSTENAIFVKEGHRWPLMIDPQGQAIKWICEMEGSDLKRESASDPNFMRTLERAIRIGEPVLLENVTEVLDPALMPILMRELTNRGGQDIIKIGDTEFEYNHNFRLYMTTGMPNPHFLPAVCIRVTLINFTVTFEGLQDQLLSTVVQQEQPVLERQRGELLESIARDNTLLRDLEDKILSLLQKSEGHILDDQVLVDTLEKSKTMSGEIGHRVAESEDTQRKIELARKKYLPVATRGAVLYFVIADLAIIDVMYQFSLVGFQDMFRLCINVSSSNGKVNRPGSGDVNRPLSGRMRPSGARNSPDLMKNVDPSSGRDSPLTVELGAKAALKGRELTLHMERMVDNLTESIYRVVSKALFAHHQLVFSFMICTSIMRSNARTDGEVVGGIGTIDDKLWQVFLQGQVLAEMADSEILLKHDGLTPLQRLEGQSRLGSAHSRPASGATGYRPDGSGNVTSRPPRWISDKSWKQCQYLSTTLEAFQGLCMYILNCTEQWNTLAKNEDPYKLMMSAFTLETKEGKAGREKFGDDSKEDGSSLGNPFNWESLQPFERLLLIKILRADALVAAVRSLVDELMGDKFLNRGEFDLKEIFEESSAKQPLIFILSPGVDPTAQLMRFAKEQRGSTLHVDMISLGRGQGPKAEELIAKAQILKGRWVFLQNCHLAASFMPRLEALVEGFNKPNADIDPQFRLWLSSKPDPSFPVSILQTGLKMTVESPQGLKANLLRSLGSGGSGAVTDALWEDNAAGPDWKSLLFGLCFFNAIVNERKKYGALGFNIPYEFSASDLEVSIQVLHMLMTTHNTTPWEALRYLTGEVSYGGRVTDHMDRRCLLSILNIYYNPDALLPEYCYSPDKVYHPLPKSFSLGDSRDYIQGLPDSDSPEVFGMHPNAEKSYRESQANKLMSTLMSVQPRVSRSMMGKGKSDDELVLELIDEIQQQLPLSIQSEDEDTTAKKDGKTTSRGGANGGSNTASAGVFPGLSMGGGFGTGGKKAEDAKASTPQPIKPLAPPNQSALLTILRQEISRFNHLLVVIHGTLTSLHLAVKGEVVMSEQLEEMYKALLNQRVPHYWQQAAYESCKPLGSWVNDLQSRVDFFGKWSDLISEAQMSREKRSIEDANTSSLMGSSLREEPRSFWLPAFFFPQGFLTAVLQNHARKESVSVDSLKFEFKVTPGPDDSEESLSDVKGHINVREVAFKGSAPPKDGVLIFGLFLDGARFDPSAVVLEDSKPEERFCRLPEIHFVPNQISHVSLNESSSTLSSMAFRAERDGFYECPLYRTSTRAGTLSSTGHSTNFVSSVDLPTQHRADLWITRGVALLCQLDD